MNHKSSIRYEKQKFLPFQMPMGEEDIQSENIKRKITFIKGKLVANTLSNNVP